jgi:hypothetical protein
MSNEKISLTEAEVEALTGLRVKTLQRWRSGWAAVSGIQQRTCVVGLTARQAAATTLSRRSGLRRDDEATQREWQRPHLRPASG